MASTLSDVIQRLQLEGDLNRNSGKNSLKSLKQLLTEGNEIATEAAVVAQLAHGKYVASQTSGGGIEEERRRESVSQMDELIEAVRALGAGGYTPENKTSTKDGDDDSSSGGFAKGALAALGLSSMGPKMKAALKKFGLPAAIALTIVDAWQVASAAFDDDFNTEVQRQDLGSVVGAAIGGGIGFALGGPAGAAIGMTIGNFVGDTLVNMFDPDKSTLIQNFNKQLNIANDNIESQKRILDLQLKRGELTEQEYNLKMADLKKEEERIRLLEEKAKAEDLKNEAEKKRLGDEANALQKDIDALNEQRAFYEAKTELQKKLENDQKKVLADLKAETRAGEEKVKQSTIDAELGQKETLLNKIGFDTKFEDEMERSGIYSDSMFGPAKIDFEAAKFLSVERLKALMNLNEVTDEDKTKIQSLIDMKNANPAEAKRMEELYSQFAAERQAYWSNDKESRAMLNDKYGALGVDGDVENPIDYSAVGQQFNNPKVWLQNMIDLGLLKPQPVVINNNTTNANTTQGIVNKTPTQDNSSAKAAASQ